MDLDTADIVVVGAGLAGATAALLLARSGASVTLVERARSPDAGRTGILVGAAGTTVLSALGLGLRPRPGPAGVTAFRYGEVAGALRAAVAAERAIAYRSAAAVRAAEPAGSVLLEWRRRLSTIDADLVVGADGTTSVVRAGGRFDVRPAGPPFRYVSGLVPGDDLDPGPERITPLGRFGGGPVDPHTTYFYAAADAPAPAVALAGHDFLQFGRLWSAADPVAGAVISRAAARAALRTEAFTPVECGRRRDGRLVLIGGAAHSSVDGYPRRAETALLDAANLIRTLAGSTEHPSPEGEPR